LDICPALLDRASRWPRKGAQDGRNGFTVSLLVAFRPVRAVGWLPGVEIGQSVDGRLHGVTLIAGIPADVEERVVAAVLPSVAAIPAHQVMRRDKRRQRMATAFCGCLNFAREGPFLRFWAGGRCGRSQRVEKRLYP